jgi:hypothetical protein
MLVHLQAALGSSGYYFALQSNLFTDQYLESDTFSGVSVSTPTVSASSTAFTVKATLYNTWPRATVMKVYQEVSNPQVTSGESPQKLSRPRGSRYAY